MFRFPATSRQQLFVLSLTEKSSYAIWRAKDQNTVTTVKLNSRDRSFGAFATRDIYLWDLIALSKQVGTKLTAANSGRSPVPSDLAGYKTIPKTSNFWHQIWVDDFSDDAGAGVLQRLNTINTITTFTHPVADQNKYSASFRFSPLITSLITAENEDGEEELVMESETLSAESALWEAMVFPAMPLMVASTIPHHKLFGPAFVESMSLSVSGTGALGPVAISVTLAGGKSLVSPVMDMVEAASKEVDVTIPSQSESEEEEEITITVFPQYRKASLMDCEIATALYATAAELHEAQAEHYVLKRDYRIIEMKLNLEQTIDFAVPQPKTGLTDSHGPKFVSVPSRTVSGSITYYAMDKRIIIPKSSALTMHFGGPFFFPMPNVDWQKPTIQAVAGKGYVHTYSFIARAAPDAIAKGFVEGSENLPVSEFSIATIEIEEEEEE